LMASFKSWEKFAFSMIRFPFRCYLLIAVMVV